MTIKNATTASQSPSGVDADADPFSWVSMDTIISEPGVTSGYVPASDNCPLLEGVSIDRLPLRFQRMLQMRAPPSSTENQGFVYHPYRIPPHPCVVILAFGIEALACFLVFLRNLPYTVEEKEYFSEDPGYYYSFPGLFLLLSMFFITKGVSEFLEIRRARKPLYARGKFCAEDWKGGTYLIGSEALIDYDGSSGKAWCYPTVCISHVVIDEQQHINGIFSTYLTHNTYLVLRSEKRHRLVYADERVGQRIQDWHTRSIFDIPDAQTMSTNDTASTMETFDSDTFVGVWRDWYALGGASARTTPYATSEAELVRLSRVGLCGYFNHLFWEMNIHILFIVCPIHTLLRSL